LLTEKGEITSDGMYLIVLEIAGDVDCVDRGGGLLVFRKDEWRRHLRLFRI
jgi:hypothetical protein